jgi:hypothetical protein
MPNYRRPKLIHWEAARNDQDVSIAGEQIKYMERRPATDGTHHQNDGGYCSQIAHRDP